MTEREQARADREQARAEQEQARANEETLLEKKLRELGVDPNQLG